MTELTNYDFLKMLAVEYNIELKENRTLRMPANPKLLKQFTMGHANSTFIFDGETEHPYMIGISETRYNPKRNEEKLAIAKELRQLRFRRLDEVIKEAKDKGAVIKSAPCQISEGGGWHSSGTAYFYKDFYTEQ